MICLIFSQSKLWIKIQGLLLELPDGELSSNKIISLTGVLGLYQPLFRPIIVLSLVQGVLEIMCWVEIYMSPTAKNKQLFDIYRNYVDLVYYEWEISNTVGSFIVREIMTSSGSSKSSEVNAEKNNTKLTSHHKDILLFFVVQPKTTGTKASQINVIELSDNEKY